jgi:hypothetical protein
VSDEVRVRYERNPEAWKRLALPPGWAFVLGPDHEDLYQERDALS